MFYLTILDKRAAAYVGPDLARQIESEIYLTVGATAVSFIVERHEGAF